MSNTLSTDKQIAIIAALAEGSSIRGIERMTGVHRDTIMRLGVKIVHTDNPGQLQATIDKLQQLEGERLAKTDELKTAVDAAGGQTT